MAATAAKLEPGEEEAMAVIVKAMHEGMQLAAKAGGAHIEKALVGMEALVVRPPPAHLGHALPRALLDVTSGIVLGALSLVVGPVVSTLVGANQGGRAFATGVAESLKNSVKAPAMGAYTACKEVCLGAAATPGAIAQSMGRASGLCVAARPRSETRLKVAIATSAPTASRGDIQPVMAVATRLQEAGAIVKILMFRDKGDHESMLKSVGLDVTVYMSYCTLYEHIKAFSPKVFIHRFTHLGLAWVAEEQLGVTSVEYNMWPEPGETAYRFGIVKLQRDILNAHLGVQTLSNLTESEMPERMAKQPFLYAFSAQVTGYASLRAASTKEGFHVTGFWDFTKDQQEGFYRSANSDWFGNGEGGELEAFLDAGEPPVYIGWGSLTVAVPASQLAAMAVRALRLLGRRGIILGSYGSMGHHDLKTASDAAELEVYSQEHVLWAKWLPHQWLLPRCCAAVHHGGASTTAASLRAGTPTVVTPVILDQFFWGYHVKRLGVGEATGELKAVDAETLAAALRRCEEPEVVARAAALGERLREEDGAADAARWIQDFCRPPEVPELAGAEPSGSEGGTVTGAA